MKKKKKKQCTRIRLLEEEYNKQPNIYAFLIGKGVDSDVAEAAQEMVYEYYRAATKRIDSFGLHDSLINARDDVLRVLVSVAAEIEDAFQPLEDIVGCDE